MRHCWPLLLLTLLTALGCRRPAPAPATATPTVPTKVEAAGLHNVYRLADNLFSGSVPEGDEGFASLTELGVRTVLSVDGARPDVDRARKHGLRYAHVPIGYGGITRDQALRVARAVRDLPGPVYLHCHHGTHRGPAAAAVALRCLDDDWGGDEAVAWLRTAGTAANYKGLYAAARDLRPPSRHELHRVPGAFPEVAEVGGLAGIMVEVDQRWEHLQLARKANWRVPPAHPDIDPAHEALQLAELYREAGRSEEAKQWPETFHLWLTEAQASAQELEEALRQAKGAEAEKAYRRSASACTRCHAKYRDARLGP